MQYKLLTQRIWLGFISIPFVAEGLHFSSSHCWKGRKCAVSKCALKTTFTVGGGSKNNFMKATKSPVAFERCEVRAFYTQLKIMGRSCSSADKNWCVDNIPLMIFKQQSQFRLIRKCTGQLWKTFWKLGLAQNMACKFLSGGGRSDYPAPLPSVFDTRSNPRC